MDLVVVVIVIAVIAWLFKLAVHRAGLTVLPAVRQHAVRPPGRAPR